MNKRIAIVAAKRSPIGSFMGVLSPLSAVEIATQVTHGLAQSLGLDTLEVDEVLIGQVLQAGSAQAPARQVAENAGLSAHVPATTVNKVCASGMKTITMATQALRLGDAEAILVGGMESMTNAPHFSKLRQGAKYGATSMEDTLAYDGLRDAYNKQAMGVIAEQTAIDEGISREQQDAFALESYARSAQAWKEGFHQQDIIPLTIKSRRGETIVDTDEEFTNLKVEKVPTLKSPFKQGGSVTAVNASTINDGAAMLYLMTEDKAKEMKLKPMAFVTSYADAALTPEEFTLAPEIACKRALDKAKLSISDIDFVELNEAFSVVGVANTNRLGLDPAKVNVMGGAVSLGHPLGCSGARIVVTLLNVLRNKGGKYGMAGICNGGGGATAIIVENNQ